ncbi:MAG TPA: hypothetical protein VJN72_14390 [Gaiellales bacterium]|nr:hypothetical protein [Gaiellales bacterium]
MALQLPYTIAPGDEIDAIVLMAMFQSIADKFSGGIVDADCSVLMALLGTKVAVNSLPGDRIASGTITKTQMGTSSVGTPQLEALSVTKDKLTTTVGSRVTKAQTEIKTWLKNDHSFNIGGNILLALECEVAQQVVLGTNSWRVVSRLVNQNAGTGAVTVSYFTAAPAAAVPVASTQVLGLIVRDVTATTGLIGWTTELVYIDLS